MNRRTKSTLIVKKNSLTRIRGICVLLVIFAHLLPYLEDSRIDYDNYGNSGVIGFFTLSSYLICSVLFNKTFSYKRFIIRRLIRIYPLFVINFIIFTLAINLFIRNEKDYYGFLSFDMFDWFLLIGNYSVNDGSPFGHLWSVCVEMHFYLCLPLFSLITNKNRNILLVFLIIFSCLINFYSVNALEVHNVWKLTTSHLGSFCIGALLAANEKTFKKFIYSREVLIIFIPVVAYLANNRFTYLGSLSGIYYLVLSLMYALIILLGLQHPTKKYSFLHYLGERSYSIYLTHFTVIYIFMSQYKSDTSIPLRGATLQQVTLCFIIIFLVGSLEFFIFERKILNFKTKVDYINY